MSDQKVILVRSEKKLVKEGFVGYGWPINFSEYETIEDLLKIGFKDRNRGRKTNQIKRFFALKKEDLVVVPVYGAIAIARVDGDKSFVENPDIKFSDNRVKVSFLSDKKGNIFIPRKELSTALQSRLKIRQSISNLSDFSNEILKIVNKLDTGEMFTLAGETQEKEEKAKENFTKELSQRLKGGKLIKLEAGGYGLEKLIKELLEIKGYDARILGKNQSSDVSDIDIEARRFNELTQESEVLLVQAKHHSGCSNSKGVKQLTAHKVEEEDGVVYRKILITTASIEGDVKYEAKSNGIITIDGNRLVELIYDEIDSFSSDMKMRLGIAVLPSFI